MAALSHQDVATLSHQHQQLGAGNPQDHRKPVRPILAHFQEKEVEQDRPPTPEKQQRKVTYRLAEEQIAYGSEAFVPSLSGKGAEDGVRPSVILPSEDTQKKMDIDPCNSNGNSVHGPEWRDALSGDVGQSENCPIAHRVLSGLQEVLSSQQRLETQFERLSIHQRNSRDGDDLIPAPISAISSMTGTSRSSRSPPPPRWVRLSPSWPASVPMRSAVDTLMAGADEDINRDLSVRNKSQGSSIRRPSFELNDYVSLTANARAQRHMGYNTRRRTLNWTEWRKEQQDELSRTWQPNGTACITWELIGFLVLLHDLCFTPLLVAWDVMMSGTLLCLNITSTAYWGCALVVEFQTGFYHHGELIMDRKTIAHRYLRGWFVFDVALLVSDLVVAGLHHLGSTHSASTERLIRMSKICRFLKVFRLVRFIRLLNKFSSSCLTTSGRMMLQAAKIVFSVLIYNHFVCCAWYMTGKNMLGKSWLGTQSAEHNEDMLYMYLTSFHWTLAQMTPGPINITATNSVERAFNCVLLIIGLLFGSSIVSVVTGHIMQMIILRRDKTQKLDTLRRFLRQNAIRQNLAVSVQRQVMQRLESGKFLEESQVSALDLLSVQLRQELTVASRMPHLRVHPLFQAWDELNAEVLPAVSLSAARAQFLPSQDELFFPGMQLSAAYFLISGEVFYTQDPDTSMVKEVVRVEAPLNTLICEAALWSDWHAVGRMESKTETHIVAIEAEDLYVVVNRFPNVASVTQHYARAFHLRIASAVPPHAPWPTDLVIPFTEGSDLLSPQVGVRTLRMARINGILDIQDEAMQALEEEVKNEKCAIQRSVEGTTIRVVAVVCLHVQRSDSRFLAQLGHWDKVKGAKMHLQLPGTKRRMGELPQAAFERVLDDDLSVLRSSITLEHLQHQVERKHSEKYRMATVYNRAVHFCNVSEPLSEEDLPLWLPEDDSRPPVEMHCITTNGRTNLYGWVTDDEFSHYSEAGRDIMTRWIENLGSYSDAPITL